MASANTCQVVSENFSKNFSEDFFMKLSGSAIVERIDSLLKRRNEKRASVCKAVGITSMALTDWARRDTIPAADTLLRVADYLGVSLPWLITGEGPSIGAPTPESTDHEEVHLIDTYRKLNASAQTAVRQYADEKLELQEVHEAAPAYRPE
jgi:transcriptional regulator with XRE-family HTH domain